MQEAHGVLLNKHYEIPFEKEYAMGFPLYDSVTNATGYIAEQVTTYISNKSACIPVLDATRINLSSSIA